jgi:hypothetical protein
MALSRSTPLFEQCEDGFLGMQAVFGLVENGLRVRFENVGRDLFAAVSGETVHDQR